MTVAHDNPVAERATLGAMLMDWRCIDDVMAEVSGPDFYRPYHEDIWTAITSLHAEGERPNIGTVGTRIGGALERNGGWLYLHELTTLDNVASAAQGPYFARAVRDSAIARRLDNVASTIRQRVQVSEDIRTTAEDIRTLVDDATATAASSEAAGMVAAELFAETVDDLEKDLDPGIATGWPDLDDVVNGMRPGQLIIVGARPSVGKSVLGANIAAHACKAGIGVHFASLEMSRTEIMQRLIAAQATIDLGRLINHSLSGNDWDSIRTKGAAVHGWPLFIDETPAQSLLQIRSRSRTSTRRLKAPLGLIIIDYLQLMAPRSLQIPREQQIGEISGGLKVMAKELKVPVIALAQLNRESARTGDGRPKMSDLRESGRLEADADGVWLLHRQDLVDKDSATGEIEVIVAKNRNGASGRTARLMFQGHYSRAVSRVFDPTAGMS